MQYDYLLHGFVPYELRFSPQHKMVFAINGAIYLVICTVAKEQDFTHRRKELFNTNIYVCEASMLLPPPHTEVIRACTGKL